MRLVRQAVTLERVLLVLILAAGLVLRLVHNDYGLPYVLFNSDEESHFASRAVAMVEGDGLNPHYYGNPTGFTYVVFLALRALYVPILGIGPLLDLDEGSVGAQFRSDPTPIWVTARTLAAVLGVLAAAACFFAGKRLWGPAEGLVAAAVLSFAFLPVVYSRTALTDIGSLLPVAVAVYGAVRIYERGARSDYLLTGVAIGVAAGFKYSNGILILALLAATLTRLPHERAQGSARPAVVGAAIGLSASAVAFLLTTPYFLLQFHDASGAVAGQRRATGEQHRYGQAHTSGLAFYVKSLGWGLGWGVLAAAAVGAAVELRRNAARAAILLAFPLVLLLLLASSSAYFARYLLPAYPVLALLAGVGIVRTAALFPARRLAPLAVGVLALAILVQPLATDVRVTRLLGKTDTRVAGREFLVSRYGPGLRAVLEPAVPGLAAPYFRVDRADRERPQFARKLLGELHEAMRARGLPGSTGFMRPQVIDVYRRAGFCVVMTLSLARGRAENENDGAALEYYRRLEREGQLIFRADPYGPGASAPKFDFDLSYMYYTTAFDRPGPEVRIYRLRRCRQGYGDVPLSPELIRAAPRGGGLP
jgi:hypothetical protein